MAASDATAFSTPSNCRPSVRRSTRPSPANPELLRLLSLARACRRTRVLALEECRINSKQPVVVLQLLDPAPEGGFIPKRVGTPKARPDTNLTYLTGS